ncbi:MAG: hypothetical protein KAX20_07070 [Candidatus Omnitrophica bacterium]|nr:hypothetical protein [Candidatus Omnitrophota bacterium]
MGRTKKSITGGKAFPRADIRAVALLSGGLDSVLALKIVLCQGIKVKGVNFITPFLKEQQKIIIEQAGELGIPLMTMSLNKNYLDLVRRPKYGYGKWFNPCIDCRILMLKKAKSLLKEKDSFIVTGEVLGQRPSSQYKDALLIIEKEAGLSGRVLRPLSARLLPPTIPEKEGLIKREKLLDISGRSRRRQLELAKEFGISKYLSPAGGCLLTEKEFSRRLSDLFEHKKRIETSDVELLKVGRHFRLSPKTKLIVGRDERENKILLGASHPERSRRNYFLLEANDVAGPIGVLENRDKDLIPLAARIIARYSDAKDSSLVSVNYWNNLNKSAVVVKPLKNIGNLKSLRIGSVS